MADPKNVFLIFSLVACSNSFNILLVHELGTKSHLIQLFPIIEGLLEQGHTVNAAIFSPSKIKHENYTEIPLKNVFEKRNVEQQFDLFLGVAFVAVDVSFFL